MIYRLFISAIFCVLTSCLSDVDEKLDEVESIMQEHPDSALYLMEMINIDEINSKSRKARYAILLTQARDKNYFFETNDSIISIATSYYGNKKNHCALMSYYYKALILFNKKDYVGAIENVLNALECIQGNEEFYMMAKVHELIADIYYQSFNMDKAIIHRDIAHKCYYKIGKDLNSCYSVIDMAIEHAINGDNDRAITILDSISPKCNNKDSMLIGYLNHSYIRPFKAIGKNGEAIEKFNVSKEYWGRHAVYMQNLPTIASVFIEINELDSAKYYLNKFKEINSDWANDENYHLIWSEYCKKQGDNTVAILEYEWMLGLHNEKVRNALKNNIALAESEFYNSKSIEEHFRAERYNVVICFLVILFTIIMLSFFVFHKEKMKNKRRQIENKMVEAQCLNIQLSERNILLIQQDALVERLFKDRLSILDRLATVYFEKRDSELMKSTIIKDFEKEIAIFKSDKSLERLQNVVNQCKDNILNRIREQLPKFKESDILFITLVLSGFSPRSVCLFMDISIGNYYNKWTRLRARILKSDAVDKELFLRVLNNRL